MGWPRRERIIDREGYVRLYKPGHHRANKKGYVLESVLVAEQKYERPIGKNEVIHHINLRIKDNRPENLEIMSHAMHYNKHRQLRFEEGMDYYKNRLDLNRNYQFESYCEIDQDDNYNAME